MSNHVESFFLEAAAICRQLNKSKITDLVHELLELRNNKGRLFVLGLGGSAANASHFCNDLRKICGLETYAPSDNISELTARTNDEGFNTIFVEYLKISKLREKDAIFILSVGGGAEGVSECLIEALNYSKEVKAKSFGIVGKSTGYTAKNADLSIIVPLVNSSHITGHTEAFQLVILHAIVSHPHLQLYDTRW